MREDPATEAMAVNLGHSTVAMSWASLGLQDIVLLVCERVKCLSYYGRKRLLQFGLKVRIHGDFLCLVFY
jgi:hypothetical protein